MNPVVQPVSLAGAVSYLAGHIVREANADLLREYAAQAAARWQAMVERAFAPECLTVILSNRCNLACAYCYTKGNRLADACPASLIEAAARQVAACCRQKGVPFQLVLHGGGEPALEWERMQEVVALTRGVAAAAGIEFRAYLATNGVMDQDRVPWLAANFDEIGLSCDGPPDIQDRQRPNAAGQPTSASVMRTAAILRQCGARFTIRATITPLTTSRQAEIVAWLHDALGATRIRFEPVYLAGAEGFQPEQADWFVHHYRLAERAARERGCLLEFPDVRLEEIHGPHCNRLKGVLQLLPDGSRTECFAKPLRSLGTGPGSIPERCRACVNVLHCARECPEVCLASGDPFPGEPGFRCLVARQLSESWILEAAGIQRTASSPLPESRVRGLLREAEPWIDVETTVAAWSAVRSRYAIEARALPPPLWAKRGYDHAGSAGLSFTPPGSGPISVYAHVPFCDRQCGFCDCYSVPLADHRREREVAFTDALVEEIEAWNVRGRPVTTIHFGGGTPAWLSPKSFERIAGRLRERLGVTSETEWAIESTTSLAGPDRLDWLWRLGFRRLHLGIQSLQEDVRRAMGRRETAAQALARLAAALDRGFVTTVDLVFGLPRQTMSGWMRDLETLADAGADGFSLYGLQVTNRNRRFLERRAWSGGNPVREYLLFCAADQYLMRRGFQKNYFTHFAGPRDRNLYYTHAARGEDLLALGPTADGVFDGCHYRHPELAAYLAGPAPAIEGTVKETGAERAFQLVMRQLMGGRLALTGGDLCCPPQWREAQLLNDEGVVTANGSWFMTQMLEELEAAT